MRQNSRARNSLPGARWESSLAICAGSIIESIASSHAERSEASRIRDASAAFVDLRMEFCFISFVRGQIDTIPRIAARLPTNPNVFSHNHGHVSMRFDAPHYSFPAILSIPLAV